MRLLHLAILLSLSLPLACGPSSGARSGDRTPAADKWLARAKLGYQAGDFEDASHSAEAALLASPRDGDIRTLSARIALTRLDYAQTIKLTEGMTSADALSLRGRAHWYAGDIEQAADDLETMLQDPAVKDPWAREVAGLARRGTGRHPFAIEGSLIASVDMPPVGPAMIVPCELEGDRILALVSTAIGEVIVDSNTRKESAWVNLRFGEKFEVKDVPALTQDLSGISRQLGAPIKALLGVNLLRHLHVTFDRRGDQFVVRRDEAGPPPDASLVPLWYIRGGGMMVRVGVSKKEEASALVDSSVMFPIALDDATWKRAGVDVATMKVDATAGGKVGTIPMLRLGSFDLPNIPGMGGGPLADMLGTLEVNLNGVVGAGLLSVFRVTLTDGGRAAWIEADPAMGAPAGTRGGT